MIHRIKKKIYDIKNINIIKNSGYFDENFYISNYPEILNTGMIPVNHYYYFGWKEHRNPSAEFDNNLYLSANNSFKIEMNPILHYMKYGQFDPKIVGPKTKFKKKVSDLLSKHFNESNPLKTFPILREKNRLNIIFNGFDKGCFFGGKATALILAIHFVNTYHYDLRIIAQNPEENIFYQFLELFKLKKPENVEFFATNLNQHLEISNKDHFLCTMWVNADAVLNTPEITGKIFYIMQEVETFFYDHGDYHLRCFNTLTDKRLIPLVNSKLLYDYLVKNGYENVKKNGIYFEPVFSKDLLKPSHKSFTQKEKYNLFYYARPSHQRNIFYFGLENLNEAFLTGRLNPKEWIVYTAGDKNVPSITFDADVEVKDLGIMDWNDYCSFISTIDLCYSMIYTPHPSYPPLDSTTAGAVCVTNQYANKQDLSFYSKNIITAELKKESMLDALEKGAKLAKDLEQRKKNYNEANTIGTWDNAFKDSIKHMNKFLKDDQDV